MEEIDILKAYQEAHIMCRDLGLTLSIQDRAFAVLSDGEEIYTKVRINGIIDFLRGYQCGCTAP